MSLKVFVLDDDELIRATLTNFLQQEGYQVYSFSQPDHCQLYYTDRCVCKKDEPCADVIISDLNMPGQNGMQFIENQIRKGCKVRHIAVMSGDWGDPAIQKAREMGCLVLQKPFSILTLRKWLDDLRRGFEIPDIPAGVAALESKQTKNKVGKLAVKPELRPAVKVEK